MGKAEKTHSDGQRYSYVTKQNYSQPNGLKCTDESKTEQTGWLPPQLQVQRLVDAGQRLDDYRKFVYDFQNMDEIPDSEVEQYIDPTRESDFDLSDITRIKREIRIREKEREYYSKLKDSKELDKIAEEEAKEGKAIDDTKRDEKAEQKAQKND